MQKVFVGCGRALFNFCSTYTGKHLIQVNTVGKSVAKAVGSIPCKLRNVLSDFNRAEFILIDFTYHLTRNGHYANQQLLGRLASGKCKHEADIGGTRIWIRQKMCDTAFVLHFKINFVRETPGCIACSIA